jgi:hypothetical protein
MRLNSYDMFMDGNADVVAGDQVLRAMINCYACRRENDTHLIGSHWEHHHWKLLKHCYNVQLVPTGNSYARNATLLGGDSTGQYYNAGGGHDLTQLSQALFSQMGGKETAVDEPPPKERRGTFIQGITSWSITFR